MVNRQVCQEEVEWVRRPDNQRTLGGRRRISVSFCNHVRRSHRRNRSSGKMHCISCHNDESNVACEHEFTTNPKLR